jgi:hypothetical protein
VLHWPHMSMAPLCSCVCVGVLLAMSICWLDVQITLEAMRCVEERQSSCMYVQTRLSVFCGDQGRSMVHQAPQDQHADRQGEVQREGGRLTQSPSLVLALVCSWTSLPSPMLGHV